MNCKAEHTSSSAMNLLTCPAGGYSGRKEQKMLNKIMYGRKAMMEGESFKSLLSDSARDYLNGTDGYTLYAWEHIDSDDDGVVTDREWRFALKEGGLVKLEDVSFDAVNEYLADLAAQSRLSEFCDRTGTAVYNILQSAELSDEQRTILERFKNDLFCDYADLLPSPADADAVLMMRDTHGTPVRATIKGDMITVSVADAEWEEEVC